MPSVLSRSLTAERMLGGDRRDGGKPLRQGLEIEPGAADHDGQAPCPLHRRQRRARIDAPAADGVILRRVDMAVQQMGRRAPPPPAPAAP